MVRHGRFLAAALLLASGMSARGQEPAEPCAFLSANESFGINLLTEVHAQNPDKNTVVAPLPVSLAFAALEDNISDGRAREEILKTFYWEKTSYLGGSGKMLLARFAKPKPRPIPAKQPTDIGSRLMALMAHGDPQELWLTATFLYRDTGAISKEFIDNVKEDFALEFRPVGIRAKQSAAIAQSWDPAVPMPHLTGNNDFWISSATHLRTAWAGNTFVGVKREKATFTLASGTNEEVDFLKSELSDYHHVLTKEFEALTLKGVYASIVFVLPRPGKSISELEKELGNNTEKIQGTLRLEIGDVQMPPFHFAYETNLRDSLEKLGVRRVFEDMESLKSIAPRTGASLQGVQQKTTITVDETGIRADSGTVVTGVLGGILGGQYQPFHMVLDRPFLFFIRDNVTEALLFAGVVMDPLQE